MEPDLEVWRKRVAELLPLVDMVKVSDEDLASLYPGADPEAIIADWLKTGVKLLVLTRGGAGASLWSAQARRHQGPAHPGGGYGRGRRHLPGIAD
ncbi:MAG: hypothetical protein R3E89_06230 [Thiolinea sp.]